MYLRLMKELSNRLSNKDFDMTDQKLVNEALKDPARFSLNY
jgi:hypothetical protein